jgi:hypothetical protein
MAATHARTRVPAVLFEACLVVGTLGINDALRLALDVRVADVIPDAATRCGSSLFCAVRIATTGRGVAGFDYPHRSLGGCRGVNVEIGGRSEIKTYSLVCRNWRTDHQCSLGCRHREGCGS